MNQEATRGYELESAPGYRLLAACRRRLAAWRSSGPGRAARWWEEGESRSLRASTRPLAARAAAVPEAPPTVLVRIPSFTDTRPAGDGES